MDEEENFRDIESIEELVALVHLVEVRPYEISARAVAPPSDEPGEIDINVEYSEFHTDRNLIDRFKFTARTEDAEYVTDLAAVYESEVPVRVPTPIRLDFAERIGFMSAFPFIRESLSTSAARLLRRAPLLDLMRPGDLKIDGDSAMAGKFEG